jgi:glycosyltransferase involved in cell wall biosynthesis
MLFSVVIATYNRGALLPRALDSLWKQTFRDFEVIAVDGESTDGTGEYLQSLGDRVKVLSEPGTGPGAARNLGSRYAQGQYLVFLDSDDLWFPWTLATFARAIEEYNRPDFIAASHREFSTESDLEEFHDEQLQAEEFADYLLAGRRTYFVGANMMIVRKAAFDAMNGFTEKHIYHEDSDLALRLGRTRFIQIHSPVTVAYRRTPGSARSHLRRNFEGVRNLIQSEKAGKYPGGAARRLDRLWLITLHTRSVSIDNLLRRQGWCGWRLYWQTFAWQVRLRRWKYLFGFPLVALGSVLGITRATKSH